MSSKAVYYDMDDSCCPRCCLAGDLGVHDYCLPCATNPCCPSVARQVYSEPIREDFTKYDEPVKNEPVKEKSTKEKSSKEKKSAAGDGGKNAKK